MMADVLVAALNAYNGDNEWEDVIYLEEGWKVDRKATESEDPNYRSDVVVLMDGSKAIWNETTCVWEARAG